MAKKNLNDSQYDDYFYNHQKRNKKLKTDKKWSKTRITLVSIGVLFLAFLIFIVVGLPSFTELENPKPPLASKVFSSDGNLLGQFFIENRIETNIDSLPKYVSEALISTEDRKFFDHWGVDLGRFVKAMVKNVFTFHREGASTITQQLAKNLYQLKAGRENTLQTGVRKIREWITAVQIERAYTKDEILELYLNVSYFGRSAYGIETASRIYFDKPAKELTLPEAALFVALLKSPVNYDPILNQENAIRRRNLVMFNMVDAGYLTKEKYEILKQEPITLAKEVKTIRKTSSPAFLEYVRLQLEEQAQKYGFDLYRDGLTIYTTLDSKLQKAASEIAESHLKDVQSSFDKSWNWNNNKSLLAGAIDRAIKNSDDYQAAESDAEKTAVLTKYRSDEAFIEKVKKDEQRVQMGFVCMDPSTGHILAMIGGANQDFGRGLNHATGIRRQCGSSFKPIVYATALERGATPNTVVSNERLNINGWNPSNSGGSTGGSMTLRQALAFSVNLVSAHLTTSDMAPPSAVIEVAQKMGIKSPIPNYPSIALGTCELTPLEMVSAYCTFANKGKHPEPQCVTKIEDKNGMVIVNFEPQISDAISPQTAVNITDMMKGVVEFGTGRGVKAYFHRTCAGKTGTTQDYADAWFIGFTPQMVAGLWVGFDDHRVKFPGPMGQGARAALPMWARFMAEAYKVKEMPPEEFSLPEGSLRVTVCDETGLKATPNCPSTHVEIMDHEPADCDVHKSSESIPEGTDTPW